MPATSRVHEFLHEAHVPYSVVPHRPAFTSQEDAAVTHVPGRDWAKVVVCFVDGEPIQAVIPAPSIVDLERLLELTGGNEIRLAQEDELRRLFPDCDSGAMPPLGPLYGQMVFADVSLAAEPAIVFSAGTVHRCDRDALGGLRQDGEADRREVCRTVDGSRPGISPVLARVDSATYAARDEV